jgi:hypothetical protein
MNPSEIPVDPASPFVGTLVVQLILAVACVGTMQRRKWLASQSPYVRAVLSAFMAMVLIILLNGPSLELVSCWPPSMRASTRCWLWPDRSPPRLVGLELP